MGIYVRGSKLWIRYKDAEGKWRDRSSGLAVGQEDMARAMYDELVRRLAPAVAGQSRLIRELPEPVTLPIEESAKGGWVYAIALVPDIDPRRLKIGWTATTAGIAGRMSDYRTANPTARLVGLWQGGRRAEKIAHGAAHGRIGTTEVFQVHHVPSTLATISAALDRTEIAYRAA